MQELKKDQKQKAIDGIWRSTWIEIVILIVISIIIFILSTLQVKNILSIWNQNDEFGVWQGGAWILGLDWSEVASTNGYYGYGYGFILAFFIKLFGHDTVLMTHMAIYFQGFMHTSCIFIAWWCIKKMFPLIGATERILASSVCMLSIPDLFYVYMFFSECLLRFVVWCIFGIIVSYSNKKKWYKLFLLNALSIYAFSVHQRCILLVGMAVVFTFCESIICAVKNESRARTLLKIAILILAVFLFYKIEYEYAQASYISDFYSANGTDSAGGNLLSERGYTIKSILCDVFFNFEVEKIALQNMLGFIYYICAIDCGFVFWGVILCFNRLKMLTVSRNLQQIIPYIYMGSMTLIGILMVVYLTANEEVYTRVELMHYARYCSYLFAPLIMFGMIGILESKYLKIRRVTIFITIIFLVAGMSTYTILKRHNVTNLFSFANACPGIVSVYYTDNPFTATLYHTVLGVLWIIIPAVVIVIAKKNIKIEKYMLAGIFALIAIVWISIGNDEWAYTHNLQNGYVTQTYELQKVLNSVDEFVDFKALSYGSGLIQYNNVFSKIHVCRTLDEFDEEENGLLVVSQKGITEMSDIVQKYDIEYENERYFVWRYEMGR